MPRSRTPQAGRRLAWGLLLVWLTYSAAALGWQGHVIFTSGASEAIAIGLGRTKARRVVTSAVEHDAVLRVTKGAERLAVDGDGIVRTPVRAEPVEAPFWPEEKESPSTSSRRTEHNILFAIQHVNNETGVIQPLGELDRSGAILFADCAQSAGKLPLPDADMIAISGHKFGGPPGIGALLIRDLALIEASGGQEQGYRAGTENLPAILAMAAALEARTEWLPDAARLRARLDAGVEAAGGQALAVPANVELDEGGADDHPAARGKTQVPGASSGAVSLAKLTTHSR